VPYVTGSTYGSAYGNSSSYSQLSVGFELDITPFINPDGLVVMDIQQEIDDLNGTTHIDNVGDVPNTTKRTLNSEIAVRDRDTVILGGFIRSDKNKTKSGVPFLMDIPLLGNLFSYRSDSKDRSEMIVMIRPTVLKTPELAAAQAIKEEQRLPGISAAAADDAAYERRLVEAQRKVELKRAKSKDRGEGFYNTPTTNSFAPQSKDSGLSTPAPAGASTDTNPVAPLKPQ
jgi:general secretion pathway protein D